MYGCGLFFFLLFFIRKEGCCIILCKVRCAKVEWNWGENILNTKLIGQENKKWKVRQGGCKVPAIGLSRSEWNRIQRVKKCNVLGCE